MRQVKLWIGLGVLSCGLSACMSSEGRLPRAYTPTIEVAEGAHLVTVNTVPDGAYCYMEGRRSSVFVKNTPGPLVLPKGQENATLICEREGFQTTRGPVLPGPPPPDGEPLIIQRVFIPNGVKTLTAGPAGDAIPDGFVGTYRR